jgi:hypothetical protein
MRVNPRNLCIALLAVAACSSDSSRAADSAKAVPKSYVGYGYDPLPPGVSVQGASEIVGPDGKPTHFVLSHVLTPLGNTMWLDSVLPNDGMQRRRIVRAELVIVIPSLTRLVISTCDVSGKLDPAVVALVRDSAGTDGKYGKVFNAWRANPAQAKFDTVPSNTVVCEEANPR